MNISEAREITKTGYIRGRAIDAFDAIIHKIKYAAGEGLNSVVYNLNNEEYIGNVCGFAVSDRTKLSKLFSLVFEKLEKDGYEPKILLGQQLQIEVNW